MSQKKLKALLLAYALAGIGVVFLLSPRTLSVNVQVAVPAIFILCTVCSLAWVEVERRTGGYSYHHSLNPRNASWAFLADPYVAVAIAILASERPMLEWTEALVAGGVAVAIALLGALGIRLLDKGRYSRHGAHGSYNSLSKFIHDFFCLPLLLGSLAGMTVAVAVFGVVGGWCWVAAGCVGVWVVGAVKDMLWPPNPLNQHANKAW